MTDTALRNRSARTRAAALTYAHRGWRVLPFQWPDEIGHCSCRNSDCDHPGKHPLLSGWPEKATTDTRTIEKWWGKWPEANIGLLVGGASGLVVIDIDPRNGGNASFALLQEAIGQLPDTLTIATGGGGQHLYFRYPADLKIKSRPLKGFSGIDVKADGGAVLAPPSLHATGLEYTFVDSSGMRAVEPDDAATPVDAPSSLLELLLRRKHASDQVAPSQGSLPTSNGASPYGLAALRDEVEQVRASGDGVRNDTLNNAAFVMGQLVGGSEIEHSQVEAELLAAALSAGLSEHEAMSTLKSGLGAGVTKPRSAPARLPAGEANRSSSGTPRRRIVVRNEYASLCDEALAALVAHHHGRIYTRARTMVQVVRVPSRPRGGLQRPQGTPIIIPITSSLLREQMDRAAHWVKLTNDGEKSALPPAWVADTLLARGEWPMSPLEGIVETPSMRPDGSILSTPGYDKESGLIYEPRSEFPPNPESPDQSDAIEAAKLLADPFQDFPFLSGCDRSAVISAILSIIGRAAIEGPVPLYGIRAPAPGTGKGLVAHVISIIGTGRFSAVMTPVHGDDEVRKRILSIGLEGVPVVLIDNVERALGSASLAAALTTTTFSDRQLGFNKVVTVPMRAVWLATGNGLVFRGDLGRRVIPIDMDAGVEHPEDRHKFQHPDLLAHVRAERSSFVVASLTILRAFHLAGRPQHGGVRVGSFEAWDDLVRGACIWAGLGDPTKGRARIREEGDLEIDLIRAVYTTWRPAFGDAHRTVAEVVQVIARDGNQFVDLRSALAAIDPKSDGTKLNARTIGSRFRQWKGRIVAGLRLEKLASKSHGAAQWVVTQVARESGE